MKSHSWFLVGLVIIAGFVSPLGFSAPDLTQLINDLRGDNESARVLARQLLPYQGIAAIPPLLDLLDQENPAIKKAASEILFDIANAACANGQEAERAKVSDLLVPLLAYDQPESKSIIGLRLLALTVPAGYDLDPIAALLKEDALREKARTALERIATPEACAALCRALEDAEPDFRCALLNSLAAMRNPGSIPPMEIQLKSPNRNVQLAAARALAFTGNLNYLGSLEIQSSNTPWTPEQKAEADRIRLAYLETMIQQGNKKTALPIYKTLAERSDGALQLAAIAALGKWGDESTISSLLTLLVNGDLRVRSCTAEALDRLEGAKITEKLLSSYIKGSRQIQLALLPILGARKDVRALPILLQNTKSDEADFRRAAAAALGESGNPDGLDYLLKALDRESQSDIKSVMLQSAVQLAQAAGLKGQREKAGRAFVMLYEYAPNAAIRSQIIKGIAANPVPEAFETALTVADGAASLNQKLTLLLSMVYCLQKNNASEEALSIYKKIQSFHPSLATLGFAAQGLKKLSGDVDSAAFQGFVTRWRVVGPFPFPDKKEWNTPLIGEPNCNLKSTYPVGEKKLFWKSVRTQNDQGRVNLLAELGECEQSVGYAYTEIELPEAVDAEIRMGVDDGEILWINGEKVFDNLTARPFQLDQDKVLVSLKSGVNKILLKLYQNQSAWEFNLRITTAKDEFIPFIQKETK